MILSTPIGNMQIDLPCDDKSILPLIIANRNRYELSLQKEFTRLIKPDWICIDAGANFGLHTILMSKLAQKVVAIEADKKNLPFLERNLEQNDCTNVIIEPYGLWSYKTQLKFSSANGNTACSFMKNTDYTQENEEIDTIDCKGLADIIDDFQLIKMDIEGSELFVLEGAEDVFRESKPILFIELNRYACEVIMKYPITKLISKILQLGYCKFSCLDEEITPIKMKNVQNWLLTNQVTSVNLVCEM